MLWSRLFIPTLRETPAEAEAASHQLLLRAGYIRQLAAGLYSYLFLGQRSLNKIVRIVRQEMEAIGAQEFFLPALHPAGIWRESGRWDAMGANMFRLRDRWGRDLCLGMTHEEVISALARELRSHKQLPQIWYQIQPKFRDEERPKSGLLRARQFLMKDSYSFDLDAAGLEASYEKHAQAYRRIFDRCGLRYLAVEAGSGAMGGGASHEFMAPAPAGEDWVARCPACGYAANLETAVSTPAPPAAADPAGKAAPEEFPTPGLKTIAEVAEFCRLPESSLIKSLVMAAGGKPLLVLLRGDHQLSETKLAAAAGCEVRPARPEEIREWFGAGAGSLGPVGARAVPVLADHALRGRRNLIAGANRDGYHLRNVTPGEHFDCGWSDLRQAAEGDACAACGAPLELLKSIGIGHLFKLGSRYSRALGLRVTNEAGQEITPVMGSYGIGIERILCAAIELCADPDGMALPPAIAPFELAITPVHIAAPAQRAAAEDLYRRCLAAGLDTVLDDRDERPGVKFKDADLIGVPCRVVLGKKLAQGLVELLQRRRGESREVALADAPAAAAAAIREEH